MGYFKRALKWIVNVLSVLLLLLLVLAVYGKATSVFGRRTYPNYFGYTFFSVASGSMEPTLYINDVILVKIGNKDIKEDDIITFVNKKDEVITHRVLSIKGDTVTVKGDNNNTTDAPIKRNQIIGKTVKVFPKLSVWQKILSEPKILIVLFITLLLFDFAISYKGNETKKNIKEKKVKKELIDKKKIIELFNKIKSKKKSKPKKEVKEETKEEIKIEKVNKTTDEEYDREELLELTKTIDIKKIQEKVRESEEIEEEPEEDDDEMDYTIRLDLSEIQKNIRNNVK